MNGVWRILELKTCERVGRVVWIVSEAQSQKMHSSQQGRNDPGLSTRSNFRKLSRPHLFEGLILENKFQRVQRNIG